MFTSLFAQFLPVSLDTNFTTNTLIVSPGLTYDTLFRGNTDYVYNATGDSGKAKQNMDFTGLQHLPYIDHHVLRITVNHEIATAHDTLLGDGGGQTTFIVEKINGTWQVKDSAGKKFRNVDFSTTGFTSKNCSGGMLSTGHTLSCEEFPLSSNEELYDAGSGFADTSDFIIPASNGIYSGDTLARWQNMGWIVETDPANYAALRKLYALGRMSHECVCPFDDATLYLTDDHTPGILYKFIADSANDFTSGNLYAYKELANGTGTWLHLPPDMTTMLNVRDTAISYGATMFIRLEGCAFSLDKTKLYFAETGADTAWLKSSLVKGGQLASHLWTYDTLNNQPADSILDDFYGRVLTLHLQNDSISVLVNGGNGNDIRNNLSSPDNLAVGIVGKKEVIMIHEDLTGKTLNRMPDSSEHLINEVYMLDLETNSPTVDDLIRIAISPDGSETSGGVFAGDTDSYFFNIMHPATSNPSPFNNSVSVSIQGLYQYFPVHTPEVQEACIEIYPNPASQIIHFTRPLQNAKLYDVTGQLLISYPEVQSIGVSHLPSGLYFISADNNLPLKFIIQ